MFKKKPPPDPIDFKDDRFRWAWQRSHLANERTFLAWCRTASSFIAFGLVLAKLSDWSPGGGATPASAASGGNVFDLLGGAAFLLGFLLLLIAIWRFFRKRRDIDTLQTTDQLAPDIVLMVSIGMLVAAAAVLGALYLVGRLPAFLH